HLEQMAAAGADVQQYADRCLAELSHEQCLEAAWHARCGSSSLTGHSACTLADDLLHAPQIATQQVVVLLDQRKELVHGFMCRPMRRHAVVHPVLFPESIEQPCASQHLQMARHTRLTLTHDFADLTDRQLGASEQSKEPQTRRLTGC